jgi:DNA-binding NarL/FixJ family response regulator
VVLAPSDRRRGNCDNECVKRGPVGVLVVDDQLAFRRAAAAVIEATDGFEIVGEVTNAADAIRRTAGGGVDLVLMDVNMPGTSGIEAAHTITAQNPAVAIVLVSTYASDDLPADVVSSGWPYLHKAGLGPRTLQTLWRQISDDGGEAGR